ncbi:hypothetical protein GCM10023193_60470 [Planotetraspora kaengkrachanensis]|uniref:Uncharacterized protein n=1 Tax=Planotetraspora kaengkrachanensis TaxID=575193 RepID=A0A8J3PWQ4_9ACTN|nr:hypothetical protein [Planotetraspora kaengkrachanensis]GIG82487.1 hypothetical protein Pka01_56140 [Planotetraspora kaengkrachanensis]
MSRRALKRKHVDPRVGTIRVVGTTTELKESGAGFDDVAAEGESVDDCGAEAGSVKVLVQPLKLSLEAMATLALRHRWSPFDPP